MSRLIIGLSAGDDDGVNLHKYLNSIGVDCGYNTLRMHWYTTLSYRLEMYDTLSVLLKNTKGPAIGDVGYYWLPYVEHLNKVWDDVRFICIKKSEDDIVKSMLAKYPDNNLWTNPACEYWDSLFYDEDNTQYWPKFFWPKEKAIRNYITNYYDAAFWLANDMPNFMLADEEKLLNTKLGRDALKRFIWT